jgi:hypothetical protein
MNIDRLYTLSQFIDYLKSLTTKEFCELFGTEVPTVREGVCGIYRVDAIQLNLIKDYNTFLKQPLKKEMFVNEIEYPIDIYYRPDEGCQKCPQEHYLSDLEEWQSAEKKVIFNENDWHYEQLFDRSVGIWIKDHFFNFKVNSSLFDLAEKTKGQLKLNNISL